MDDEQELSTLRHLLEQAILELIEHLSGSDSAIPKCPYSEVQIEYWPASGNSSKTMHAQRPDHLKMERLVKPIFENIASFEKLNIFCKQLLDKYGSDRGVNGNPSALQLLVTYIRQSGSKEPNQGQISIQSNKYLSSLRSTTNRVRKLTQIGGIVAAKPFNLSPGIKLRPITERDIAKHGLENKLTSILRISEWMREDAWLCVVDIRYSEDEYEHALTKSDELTTTCFSVLRLSNYEAKLSYLPICTYHTDNYAQDFRSFGGDPVPRFFSIPANYDINYDKNRIEFGRRLLVEITALKKYNPDLCGNINYALKKFDSAFGRTSEEDEIVDIATGLESLLCSDSSSEISYRFKIRGAALLDISFGVTTTRMLLLSDIYTARSDVVHGNNGKKKLRYLNTEKLLIGDRVARLLPDARNVFSKIIIWFLLNSESKSIRRGTSKHESIYNYLDSQLANCEEIRV